MADPDSLAVLSKEVIDQDGKLVLEGLGILAIWALNKDQPPTRTNKNWLPILEIVSVCEAANATVVNYLINFHEKRDIDPAVK